MLRPQDAPRETVDRKVYFYKVDAGTKNGEPVRFDPVPLLNHVAALDKASHGPEGMYLEWSGDFLFVDPVSLDYPQKVRFVLSKHKDWPEIERLGRMNPLDVPAGAGLGDKTHMMFFGEYIAAEYNHRGPRSTAIAAYFNLKAKQIGPNIRLEPVVRTDALQQLKRLHGATLAELVIRRNNLQLVQQVDDTLFRALETLALSTEADKISIRLKTEKSRGVIRYLADNILEAAKALAGRADTYEAFDKLKIEGLDELTRERLLVAILEQLVTSVGRMVRLDKRSRSVDSDSAFAVLEAAYHEKRSDLVQTSRVLVLA